MGPEMFVGLGGLASPKSEGLEESIGWALVKPSLPAGPFPLWEKFPSNLQ